MTKVGRLMITRISLMSAAGFLAICLQAKSASGQG